jgi:hypothetical protein
MVVPPEGLDSINPKRYSSQYERPYRFTHQVKLSKKKTMHLLLTNSVTHRSQIKDGKEVEYALPDAHQSVAWIRRAKHNCGAASELEMIIKDADELADWTPHLFQQL